MINDLTDEEVYLLSNADLGFKVIKESKKTMTTADLFKKVCDLKEKSEEYYLEELADYYTELNTDKRFVFLDTKEWDIRDNHVVPKDLDNEDDEIDEEVEVDEASEETEEETGDESEEEIDDDFDDEDDDLKGMTILENLEE